MFEFIYTIPTQFYFPALCLKLKSIHGKNHHGSSAGLVIAVSSGGFPVTYWKLWSGAFLHLGNWLASASHNSAGQAGLELTEAFHHGKFIQAASELPSTASLILQICSSFLMALISSDVPT